MRVAHLVTSLHDEGPGDGMVDLAEAAEEAGLELAVLVLGSAGDHGDAARLRRLGVPVTEFRLAPWDPRAVGRTVRALREHRADLLHTHLRRADVVGALATRASSVPVVSSLYKIENLPAGPVDRLRRTAKILARRRFVARTVAISHLQRERYRRFAGSDRGLVVVPNGITDPGPLTPAERDRVRAVLGVRTDLLAVSAAPMRRGKGQDLLLDAVAALPAGLPLTVVLAGDGPLRPWLAARVEGDDALAGRVQFAPGASREHLRDVVGAADVVLHTTRSDALPVPLLQAVGLGVPVVATQVGGIPEIVTRDCGLLVPLDADRIADAITRLAGDEALRARLGAGARRRFLEQFEARDWARRLRAVYDDALAGVPAEPVGSTPA